MKAIGRAFTLPFARDQEKSKDPFQANKTPETDAILSIENELGPLRVPISEGWPAG